MFTCSRLELLVKPTCKAIIHWVDIKNEHTIVVIGYVEVFIRVSATYYIINVFHLFYKTHC